MVIIDRTPITPSDPLVEHCSCCGRPVRVCDADAHGCGTTPAEPEKPETWRDRPPLL